jgi:hypothetical protein
VKLHDNYPADQANPAGFEKLSDIRERIGAEDLLRCLQLGKKEAFELSAEDGLVTLISVDEWRSRFADNMLHSGRKYHYFIPKPSDDDPANPQKVFPYEPPGRLLLVRVDQSDFSAPTHSNDKGGRPVKYDWAALSAYISVYIIENDYPDQQSILAQVAKTWFESRGRVPDSREIEKFISSVYKERYSLK